MRLFTFHAPHKPDDWLTREYAKLEESDTTIAFALGIVVAFALGMFVGAFIL